ncbi:MAG: anthranilate phosphoribosyltransferase, partial [Gemmatimonadota bacterium]
MSSAVSKALHIIAEGRFLGRNDAEAAFAELMRGEVSAARTAALLMGLRARGETPEELAGAILALRGAMRPVASSRPGELVDTCGTGGGTVGTLNISTAAAFVAAG